jgi:hypothetical protein
MLSQWTELTALFFVEDKPPYLMKAYYELLINIVKIFHLRASKRNPILSIH